MGKIFGSCLGAGVFGGDGGGIFVQLYSGGVWSSPRVVCMVPLRPEVCQLCLVNGL